MRCNIHLKVGVGQFARHFAGIRAAKQSVGSSHKLLGAEWLAYEIVCACLETSHSIVFVAARGKHDYRKRRACRLSPQPPAYFNSTRAIDHPIEDQDVWLNLLNEQKRFVSIRGGRYDEALFPEMMAD
jgi:hypothetical protein